MGVEGPAVCQTPGIPVHPDPCSWVWPRLVQTFECWGGMVQVTPRTTLVFETHHATFSHAAPLTCTPTTDKTEQNPRISVLGLEPEQEKPCFLLFQVTLLLGSFITSLNLACPD